MILRFPRKKKNFLGGKIVKKKNSKKNRRRSKIQNPARGSKKPSRGGGVDLNFRGGGHKKSKQVGVHTP